MLCRALALSFLGSTIKSSTNVVRRTASGSASRDWDVNSVDTRAQYRVLSCVRRESRCKFLFLIQYLHQRQRAEMNHSDVTATLICTKVLISSSHVISMSRSAQEFLVKPFSVVLVGYSSCNLPSRHQRVRSYLPPRDASRIRRVGVVGVQLEREFRVACET